MARSFDPVQLGSIELFCRAAEAGSFTAAAEAAGVTPAAVSRSVARLEARLGVRLFVRTTRQIRLTDDGRAYFERCRPALAEIEDAERAVAGSRSAPAGLLRISVPTTYGHYRVLPRLPEFLRRYPELRVEVNVANRQIDFVEEGYDLAIRLGEPPDSGLVARRLEDAALGVFAAPAYLARRGTPASLEALRGHDCIQFILPRTGRPMPWVFRDGGADVDFPFASRVQVSDDVLGCVTLARAGAGLFQIYRFIVEDELRRGELVEVLQPYAGRSRPFCLLYPRNRHLSQRVRAFVDFMLAGAGAGAGAEGGA